MHKDTFTDEQREALETLGILFAFPKFEAQLSRSRTAPDGVQVDANGKVISISESALAAATAKLEIKRAEKARIDAENAARIEARNKELADIRARQVSLGHVFALTSTSPKELSEAFYVDGLGVIQWKAGGYYDRYGETTLYAAVAVYGERKIEEGEHAAYIRGYQLGECLGLARDVAAARQTNQS